MIVLENPGSGYENILFRFDFLQVYMIDNIYINLYLHMNPYNL